MVWPSAEFQGPHNFMVMALGHYFKVPLYLVGNFMTLHCECAGYCRFLVVMQRAQVTLGL